MKALTPRAPGVSGSVRAKSRNVPACSAVEMNCFVPEMRQPSPFGSAAVRSEPASEPASVSVSAKAPISSPRASGGTKRERCSSVPKVRIGSVTALVCTPTVTPDSGVAPRELLEDEDVGEEVRAGAAVLLGHADAHQPELGELAEDLLREAVLAVPLGRVRLDLGRGELARERLDLPLLGAELEVHYE